MLRFLIYFLPSHDRHISKNLFGSNTAARQDTISNTVIPRTQILFSVAGEPSGGYILATLRCMHSVVALHGFNVCTLATDANTSFDTRVRNNTKFTGIRPVRPTSVRQYLSPAHGNHIFMIAIEANGAVLTATTSHAVAPVQEHVYFLLMQVNVDLYMETHL